MMSAMLLPLAGAGAAGAGAAAGAPAGFSSASFTVAPVVAAMASHCSALIRESRRESRASARFRKGGSTGHFETPSLFPSRMYEESASTRRDQFDSSAKRY